MSQSTRDSSPARSRFEGFYERKWRDHHGFWIDRYPPEHRPFAVAVYARRNAAIAAEAGPSPGRLLDLGCGVGDVAASMLGAATQVVACDLVWENVRRANENLEAGTAAVVQAAGEHLPFADGSLDTVVLADVIEHVASVQATLGEVARVLKPRGRLICVTPIRGTLLAWRLVDWAATWLARPARRPPLSLRNASVREQFLSTRGLRRAIAESGLRPIRLRRICFYPAAETTGAFGAAIARLYRRHPARQADLTRGAIRLLGAVERWKVLNQKQLWVAER